MNGIEKRALLVFGKFQKPRCFKGVVHLPTKYKATKNAWMTFAPFEEWIRKWDVNFTSVGRKIVCGEL